ncbi:MAG TPA: LamG-like jellyroll fold domain-containing protein [Propionibacteriaceae bacterium]
MSALGAAVRRAGVLVGLSALIFAGLVPVTAVSDTRPPAASIPGTVTADALPTAQIDGVVWTQTIAQGKVYVGGRFTSGRPAGAAPGEQTQPRGNFLAYDLSTGVLDETLEPSFNGQVRAVAVSPDGRVLYVGGEFTQVDGVTRNRLAAFDLATGELIPGFTAGTNASVLGLSVTADRVYLAGYFSSVNGETRVGAAALDAHTGALQTFRVEPAGGDVRQIQVSPDQTRVILGGSFTTMNGSSRPGYGLALVDPRSSQLLPLAANSVVRNGGLKSAVLSLDSDATGFFGSGYSVGTETGNLEGIFRADWNGNLVWLEDCHGDTYSVATSGPVVYGAGHAHECSTLGGFPRTDPRSFHHGLAFTAQATRKVSPTPHAYANFEGQPAPSPLHWFPEFSLGTVTGLSQATWSVAADSGYVVYGGEFPAVNGQPQQGLVRFAAPTVAPKKRGPKTGEASATAWSSTSVRVAWRGGSDPDNERLGYQLFRSSAGSTETLVDEDSALTTFWRQPIRTYLDTGLAAGRTYDYRLRTFDGDGNEDSTTLSATTAEAGAQALATLTPYQQLVLGDGPSSYWPLDSVAGGTSADLAGGNVLHLGAAVTPAEGAGAITGEPRTAAKVTSGATAGGLSAAEVGPAPYDFTEELWFKTTSKTGGQLIGFQEPLTSDSDRHVYLTAKGQLRFVVAPRGRVRAIAPTKAYNDGRWHHVAATVSAAGMALYVDGTMVGTQTDVRAPRVLWQAGVRAGDGNLAGLPDRPTTDTLDGSVDELAVYPVALSAAEIDEHHRLGTGQAVPARPFVVDEFSTPSSRGLAWASVGGPWTVSSRDKVTSAGGQARLRLAKPGVGHFAYQGATRRSDVSASFSLDRATSGSGTWVKVEGRRIDADNSYRVGVKVAPSNQVTYYLEALVGGQEVRLAGPVTLAAGYRPGAVINVRLQTYGASTSAVRAKVWLAGSDEPSAWGVAVTDSRPELRGYGAVGVWAYPSALSRSDQPVTVRFDRLVARPVR